MRSRKKQKINGTLRTLCLASLAVLVGMTTLGCREGKEKIKEKIELWLIDPHEVILRRTISDNEEQILEIKNNEVMREFYAISGRELDRIIEDVIDGAKENCR